MLELLIAVDDVVDPTLAVVEDALTEVEPWLVVVFDIEPLPLPPTPPAPPSMLLPSAQEKVDAERSAVSPTDAKVVPRTRFDGMREMLFERVGRGKPNHPL